jgi:hypothetical protein
MKKFFAETRSNFDFWEYLQAKGLNATTLKEADKFSWAHQQIKADIDNDELLLGRCVHGLLLEPDTFSTQYAILPGTEGIMTKPKSKKAKPQLAKHPEATDEYKRRVEEAKKTRPPETHWVKPQMHALAVRICGAIQSHPKANRVLLQDTQKELSLFWEAPIEDKIILCKSRLDVVCASKKRIVELKTTHNAEANYFKYKIIRPLRYDIQMAWQGCGTLACLGWTPQEYCIVAVETQPPFGITFHKFFLPEIAKSEERCIELAHEYAALPKVGPWPGYSDEWNLVSFGE